MIDCLECKHCKVEEVSYDSTKTKVMCYESPLHPHRVADEDTQCELGCDDFEEIEIEKPSIKELIEAKIKELDPIAARNPNDTIGYYHLMRMKQDWWKEVLTMIKENSND
jgi:hypothetical protein